MPSVGQDHARPQRILHPGPGLEIAEELRKERIVGKGRACACDHPLGIDVDHRRRRGLDHRRIAQLDLGRAARHAGLRQRRPRQGRQQHEDRNSQHGRSSSPHVVLMPGRGDPFKVACPHSGSERPRRAQRPLRAEGVWKLAWLFLTQRVFGWVLWRFPDFGPLWRLWRRRAAETELSRCFLRYDLSRASRTRPEWLPEVHVPRSGRSRA